MSAGKRKSSSSFIDAPPSGKKFPHGTAGRPVGSNVINYLHKNLAPIIFERDLCPCAQLPARLRERLVGNGVGAVEQQVEGRGVVAEGLQRLSQLVTEFPEIKEMDINPFMVGPLGTIPVAVDARITVEKT